MSMKRKGGGGFAATKRSGEPVAGVRTRSAREIHTGDSRGDTESDAYNRMVERQLKTGRAIMRERRDVLRKLAE